MGKKLLTLMAFVLISITGCSGQTGKNNNAAEQTGKGQDAAAIKNDPITLRMYIQDVTIPDDLFKSWIADPVKEKYPYITMELVRRPPNASLAQVVAMGDFPDMVYEGSQTMNQFITMQIVDDLSTYVKKNKMDLNKFDPTFLNAVKAYGDKDQLYAMPLSTSFDALFYNKDLFEKFNVPYPKDGVTWEELLDVMKRTTRIDGGMQYHGIRVIHNVEAFGGPFAFNVYDEKTGKAVIATDGWKRVFNLYREFKNYAGNDTGGAEAYANFTTKQDYAMFADSGYTLIKIQEAVSSGVTLNWDMVKYPRFEGNPDRGLEMAGHILMMSASSKHKDEVFNVISLLTDREVQLKITKDARMPALKDPEIRRHFGETFPVLKGKNMTPVLNQSPSPAVARKGNEDLARSFIRPAAFLDTKFMKGAADVNTTLFEVEEKANKAIEDAKKN